MRILDRINNPKRGPVSDRRIRMNQISLDPEYRLSLSKLSVQHLLPISQILLWTLGTIRTRSTTVDVDTEILRGTSTDVRISRSQNLLSILVVDWYPVASNVFRVPL